MRSEYAANLDMVQTSQRGTLAPSTCKRPARRHWGWNHKALALALVLFIVGTAATSTGLMGAGCFVLCFGIRPYWK